MFKILTSIILGIVGVLVLVILGLYFTAPSNYNILVIGSDQRGDERARSDVLFIVSMPKSGSKQPVFLSIPRDTKIDHKEHGLQKITHFYSMGERTEKDKKLGNRILTTEVVEDLLDVKVDATLEVTFDSFQEIIDSVDGVSLEGKEATGSQALARIRDRFTEGRSDFDRQANEREVFRGILTKVKSPTKARALYDYFETSDKAHVTFDKVKLARFAFGAGIARRGNISIGEMKEVEMPGESARIYTPSFGKSLYYWVVDEEELKTLVDENLK
jgi:anionic cell wall polymer biosynthesis LytR-Cps2A-Psr (LCP) family protein